MTSRELCSVINRYLTLTAVGCFILSLVTPTGSPYGVIAAVAAVIVAIDVLDTMVDAFVREWRKRKSTAKETL